MESKFIAEERKKAILREYESFLFNYNVINQEEAINKLEELLDKYRK